jgi:hypothetical protein
MMCHLLLGLTVGCWVAAPVRLFVVGEITECRAKTSRIEIASMVYKNKYFVDANDCAVSWTVDGNDDPNSKKRRDEK